MRLIDADVFKQQIAEVTIADKLNPEKCNMMCTLIDMQPTAIDLNNVIAALDRRIGIQLNIVIGLNDPVYRYGYMKSMEAYQQCKLILEELINYTEKGEKRKC